MLRVFTIEITACVPLCLPLCPVKTGSCRGDQSWAAFLGRPLRQDSCSMPACVSLSPSLQRRSNYTGHSTIYYCKHTCTCTQKRSHRCRVISLMLMACCFSLRWAHRGQPIVIRHDLALKEQCTQKWMLYHHLTILMSFGFYRMPKLLFPYNLLCPVIRTFLWHSMQKAANKQYLNDALHLLEF